MLLLEAAIFPGIKKKLRLESIHCWDSKWIHLKYFFGNIMFKKERGEKLNTLELIMYCTKGNMKWYFFDILRFSHVLGSNLPNSINWKLKVILLHGKDQEKYMHACICLRDQKRRAGKCLGGIIGGFLFPRKQTLDWGVVLSERHFFQWAYSCLWSLNNSAEISMNLIQNLLWVFTFFLG